MQRTSLLVLAFLGAVLAAGDAHALRCGGDLVDEGDRRFEVERACGEPDYVDAINDPAYARYAPHDEVWIYNFGAHRLLRVMRFRNGRLRAIDTAGSGFREDRLDAQPCTPADMRAATTAYELHLRCGEPMERSYERIPAGHALHSGHGHGHEVVENWFYDPTDRHEPRRVRIRAGRVIEVTARLD